MRHARRGRDRAVRGGPRTHELTEALRSAATELPTAHLHRLAAALAAHDHPGPLARAGVVGAVPTTLFRVHALRVYEAWASADPPLPGAAVALACRAAAEAVRTVRDDQAVSVVWTGPSSPLVPVRSTVAVLCELIDAACDELLVVSFAAYRVEAVVAALGRAADRGVAVRLVLESAEESGGLLSRDAAAAFEALAGRVGLYVWPAEKRAAHGEGHAAMHAKCAVADRRLALVTSANLTGAGMVGNMELGLLVRGGDAPARIAAHFAALVADGVLEAVHR